MFIVAIVAFLGSQNDKFATDDIRRQILTLYARAFTGITRAKGNIKKQSKLSISFAAHGAIYHLAQVAYHQALVHVDLER